MEKEKNSFLNDSMIYVIGTALVQGTTFITLIILSKLMSVDEYGKLSLYIMWFSILCNFIGLQGASTLNNARIEYGEEKIDDYSSSILGISIISFIVSFGMFFLLKDKMISIIGFNFSIMVICLIECFFSSCIVILTTKYKMQNKPKKYVIFNFLVVVFRLIISIIIINLEVKKKYVADIYGATIAYAIIGIICLIIIIKESMKIINKEYWKFCIILSLPLVAQGMANMLLGQSDRYMLSMLHSSDATGMYSFSYNIAMIINGLWVAINNSWSIWYYNKLKEKKKEEIVKLFKKYNLFVSLATIIIISIAPDIVKILGGSKYQSSMYILPIITLGGYFQYLANFPILHELYFAKTSYICIITILSTIINIALNFKFIPFFGALAAAISTCICYVIMFLLNYYVAKYIIKEFPIYIKDLIFTSIILIFVVLITLIFIEWFILRWTIVIFAFGIGVILIKKLTINN